MSNGFWHFKLRKKALFFGYRRKYLKLSLAITKMSEWPNIYFLTSIELIVHFMTCLESENVKLFHLKFLSLTFNLFTFAFGWLNIFLEIYCFFINVHLNILYKNVRNKIIKITSNKNKIFTFYFICLKKRFRKSNIWKFFWIKSWKQI